LQSAKLIHGGASPSLLSTLSGVIVAQEAVTLFVQVQFL
jgi:hypothetical protein